MSSELLTPRLKLPYGANDGINRALDKLDRAALLNADGTFSLPAGGDELTFGAIVDGEFLVRSGDEIVSQAGGGGGITGSGTAGALAKFTGATAVGDSVVTEASGGVTVTQPTLGTDVFNLKSTATNDDPNFRVLQARVTTTDDTTTALATIPLALNTAYRIEAHIVARQTAGAASPVGSSGSTTHVGTCQRIGAGAVMVGDTDLGSNTSLSNFAVDFVASGNDILVNVTGDIDQATVWHATITVQSVST